MRQLKVAVPIPERMKSLPMDQRGYPIPYTVLRDSKGKAHFAVNSEERRLRCLKEDLCPICGLRLFRGRWLVGGPGSGLVAEGLFQDPPMHSECAHYALQVCPWLVLGNYVNRVDDKTMDPEERNNVTLRDPTIIANRPPFFVALMFVGQDHVLNMVNGEPNVHIRPKKPYRVVEYWRDGHQLSNQSGKQIAVDYLRDLAETMGAEFKFDENGDGTLGRFVPKPEQPGVLPDQLLPV